jgi:hypothetical protein
MDPEEYARSLIADIAPPVPPVPPAPPPAAAPVTAPPAAGRPDPASALHPQDLAMAQHVLRPYLTGVASAKRQHEQRQREYQAWRAGR